MMTNMFYESRVSNFSSTNNLFECENKTSDRVNVMFIVLECIIAITSIVGNGIVIFAFCCERRLRRKTNYYIISLSSADFLVGLIAIPLAIFLVC
jgi:7 transmembrane receptor (rhodopsin family)